MIGFGIIIPILPYFAGSFGATPAEVGAVIGAYAAAQFIAAPLLGRLSDRYGRRNTLFFTTAFAVTGYVILGLAESLLLIFISRILTGFMSGNISVAQAYISDITDIKNRAKGYGILGAAFGLGLVTGPALGGFLSNWGYSAAAYGAAFLNLLSIIVIFFYLPETINPGALTQNQQKFGFDLDSLISALKRPFAGPILKIRFVFSIGFSIFTTVFAIYTETGLHLSAQMTAWLLTYAGILIVIIQGFLVDRLTYFISEAKLLFFSTILLAASLIGWAFIRSVPMLYVVLIPLALAGGVFNTVINSALSKIVDEQEIGGMLGISASVESSTRIFAPSMGAYLLSEWGLWAPGFISAIIILAVIPFAWKHFYKAPHFALNKVKS